MKIEDLECFLQVANHLSITRASESLHISQQALSAKMKSLEQYYGMPLFETLPNRRGIVLTYAGDLLRQSAAQMIALNRRVQNLGFEHQTSCDVYGDLRFGATNNRIRYFLQGVIAKFHNIYPNVSIHIRSGVTHQVERLLLDGTIDLALGLDSFQSDRVDFIHLIDERLFLIVPQRFLPLYWNIQLDDEEKMKELRQGVSVKSLHNMPLILFGRENRLRKVVDEILHQNDIIASPCIELSDIDSMLRFSNAGIGITFCRELVVGFNDLFMQSGCQLLTFPLVEVPPTQFVIGYRSNYVFPSFVDHFITLIREAIRQYQEGIQTAE